MLSRTELHKHQRRAFSLIEAMFSIVIIGFAVMGLMALMGSGTRLNAYGNRLSTAVLLAEEVRALTDAAPFDELLDHDGETFNALDHADNPIAGLQGYQQNLTVTAVHPYNLTAYTPTEAPTMVRLSAFVTYEGAELTRISWLRTR